MKKLRELKEHKGVRLTAITTKIEIDATHDKVWNALSQYGDVSNFHAGVVLSVPSKGSTNKAELGAVRVCDVLDGKRKIQFTERITEFKEGSCYRYEVYEWKNFPLKIIFFGFEVEKLSENKSVLALTINYRLSPGFMTNLMKWKIRKFEKDILTGYKNHIETGKKNVPIAELKELNYQFA